MRLARYSLALILLAISLIGVVGVGVGLMSRRPSNNAIRQSSRRVVYVELDKLVALHPDWGALQAINEVMADFRSAQVSAVSAELMANPVEVHVSSKRAKEAVPRMRLRDLTAVLANESLDQMGTEHLDALQSRLQENFGTMLDSAEPDIQLKTHEIRQVAADKIIEIRGQHVFEVANYQMQAAAIRSMLKKSGIVDVEASKKLAVIESALAALEQDQNTQTSRVTSEAQEAINTLSVNDKERIVSALSADERSETMKIEKRIGDAQIAIMSNVVAIDELTLPDIFRAKHEKSIRYALSHTRKIAPVQKYKLADAGVWQKKSSALRKCIYRDVISVVRKVADKRGLSVVFSKNGAVLPDETALFSRLIKTLGSRESAPVLYDGLGV